MENKELTNTDVSVQGTSPSAETAVDNGGNGAAARGRRHRRPAANKTATRTNETSEQPAASEGTPTEAVVGDSAVIAAPAGDAAPAKPARQAHHRRSGRARGAEPTTEQQTLTDADSAPTVAEATPATLPPLEPTWRPEDAPVPAATTTFAEPSNASPEQPAEPARPARRYRFDRPAPQPVVTPTVTTSEPRPLGPLSTIWSRPTPPAAPTPEEIAPVPPERDEPAEIAPFVAAITLPEEIATPIVPAEPAPEPPVTFTPLEEPVADVTAAATVTATDEANGVGNNRRHNNNRRRRGRGTGNGLGTDARGDEEPAMPPMAASTQTVTAAPRFQPATPSLFEPTVANVVAPPIAPQPLAPLPTPSPYGSPEPMHARGFGPTPRGVATEYRAMPAPRISRVERANENNAPISPNHLASIIMEAIQQQTDRLLNEQRRNTAAPAFTVAMPSTERVGVFVDVANLLYSSRSMRIPIDFGKLLNFLRGDRRLIRAHAYCPTSPEPYADQQFLQAVKGLGYRITTKDYKTFSSGAKKADLDLDLCMDIVRIVDAGAVDTIVLVSGDSDFLPLLAYCSDHGVRCEVAAFDESTATILRQSCDLFMNLSLVEEIRA